MLPLIVAFFLQRSFVVTLVEIETIPAIFPLWFTVKCKPLIFLLFASVQFMLLFPPVFDVRIYRTYKMF
jgi:hypothetical protein